MHRFIPVHALRRTPGSDDSGVVPAAPVRRTLADGTVVEPWIPADIRGSRRTEVPSLRDTAVLAWRSAVLPGDSGDGRPGER